MSSSASSSLIKPRQYDVFLSFRGEDTRNGFTSHLHEKLRQKEIETFIDNELRRGDEISPALLTAIEESKISVIIFSRKYASSKWCLDELKNIMDCKKRNEHYFVLPVFYDIDPSEVRNQRGSFAEAFAEHEEKFKNDIQKVKAWKTALTEAANLVGLDSRYIRPEPRLIDAIVNDILKKLNHGTSSCFEGLVGIERRMERVMSLLCLGHSDFRKVGIWGMGGIGKTTLAEAIFNQISGDFQSSYFLTIRNLRNERLEQLQQDFLSTILEDGNLRLNTHTILPRSLKDRLCSKMALVVCDDVTNSRQLEFLFGGKVQLGPGSRLIITTRNKQVLIQNGINFIYEVKELNEVESFQLFRQHALNGNHPTAYQMQLSKTVLNYAKGNPLAIKVVGSSLCGKNKRHMESALKKLKQVPNPDIQEMLRSSYEALDYEEKEIFLDIACFFRGEDRDRVTRIMDAFYNAADLGIENLIEKSLVTVSQKNEIAMHDLLQEMGWDVVRNESPSEPERRSRLWDPDDIHYVLKEDFGSTTLKSILIDMSRIQELELHPKAFANMRRLKFLKFYRSCGCAHVSLPQGLLSLPDELRYLCWQGYPLKTLPTKFCPRRLVELDMSYSNVEQLWEGKQDLVNLKVIDLTHSTNLIKIPDLSRAKNLENLNLAGCTNLLELPSSVQYLGKLTKLDLNSCKSLKSLPSLCKMRSLSFLCLAHCTNLTKCPEISSNVRYLYLNATAIEEVPSSIESLRHVMLLYELFLSNCPNISTFPVLSGRIGKLHLDGTEIEEVPSSIASLSELAVLDLSNCRRLRSISTSIHKLKSLKIFVLAGCSRLEIFPEILETMERLEELDLRETALKELPSSIENLIGLFELRLNNCENLACLPDSFSELKSLGHLYLNGCTKLATLPELPASVMYLCWEGYPLKTASVMYLRRLVELDMSDSNVEQLWEGKQDLVNLKVINLRRSANLIKIPDLSRATNLENLNLEYCKNLLELPSSVQYLEKLTNLVLICCASLRSLPSLRTMRSLYFLYLWGCRNLIECPEIPSNVGHLYLSGTAIEEVPSSIESLRQLMELDVGRCSKLRNLPTAICHDRLTLSNSPNISAFPVLSGSIGQLYLDETAIEEVPSSIASLSQLRLLRLSNCRRLRSISTSIHKLKSLDTLELDGCSRLEIFPEILETMERLQKLDLSETALKELPSPIENLIGLRELKLKNCKNLACLPDSFSKLKSLEDLFLIGCTNLVALPELPASLMHLLARGCTSLEEVTSPKNLFDQASLSMGKSQVSKVWLFSNCFRLDRRAVGNLGIPKSQTLFGHMVTLLKEHHHHHQGSLTKTEFITCVPGGEIPECFYYKSVGASITIQLPSECCNSRKSFSGFIASVVVSLPLDHFLIKCELSLKSCDGADCHDLGCSFDVWPRENFMPRLFGSNHLFLLYKDLSRHFEGQASDNCIYTEASFKFYPLLYYPPRWLQCDSCEVKMCGVYLLFGKDSDPNNQPPPKRLKYHS